MNKLNPFGGKLIFECNVFSRDIDIFAGANKFLKDVLIAWSSCNSKPAISSYRQEILWNNSHIKAGEQTIIYKQWHQKGIKYFKDIYDDDTKTIYSFDKLKELYQLPPSDILKYLTLIQSIPRRWKTNIKHENVNTPVPLTIIKHILKVKQTNKFIFNYF